MLTQRPLCGVSAAARLWGWIQPESREGISVEIPAHPESSEWGSRAVPRDGMLSVNMGASLLLVYLGL